FGEIRPAGPGRLEREALWRDPENAAEALWYRGLIFRAFADFGDGPMEYFYIPEDLPLPPLEQPAAPRPRSAPLPLVRPPARARHALNSLAVDGCTVLAQVRESPLLVGERPLPGSALLGSMHDMLLLPDPVRSDLLWTLATGLGWAAPDRGRWVLDNQRVGAWLRLSHWEQMSLLFTSWRDSAAWNDLKHTPGLVSEGEWTNDPALARRRLLRLLQRLDGRTWYRVADVIVAMKRTDPDFQRPDGNYSGWYLRDAESGRYLSGYESWDAVEGRLLHFLIEGPLFWLGAVALSGDIAAGQIEEQETFRLTPAGAAWLSSRMPHDPPQPARLAVGDDFIVTAPLLTPLLDRFRLARFADSLPAERWEHLRDTLVPGPTRHRITRASLARGRKAGLKPEDAVNFLRKAAAGRVPPKVAAAIERYSQLGGQVRITRGAILRVMDANTLAALRSDPVIAPLLGDLVSAQAVIVPEANLERVLAVLGDSGYSLEIS
ncbi:MAG: helicase-associated domain-containing protein, partial [Nitrososphaerales archaeon]